MGVGIINFVFAIPAFFLIDTFGRRSLLLVTFPFLALFQLFNAIAFEVKKSPFVIAALYLFAVAYSPGEGPVPFVRFSYPPRLLERQVYLIYNRFTLQRVCHYTYVILVRKDSCQLSNPD